MAKAKGGIGGIIGILLMVCAVNFIGLTAFVGTLAGMGVLNKDSAVGMYHVFTGTHVPISKKDYSELAAYREKEAEDKKKLKDEKGGGAVYESAVEAARAEEKMRTEELRIMTDRLKQEQTRLEELRKQIEDGKAQADRSREALDAEKEKQTKVSQAEVTERLKRTFANMDPGDIALDIAAMANNREHGLEYSVHLLEMMKPTLVSEVLTELQPDVRQRLVPLMENPYANMTPDEVVTEWRRTVPSVSARQIREYLVKMPTSQAVQVWRRLDRIMREDVLDLIAPLKIGNQ